MGAPEQRHKHWNQHNAEACDKSRLRGRRLGQARRLEGVAAEHEDADLEPGAKFGGRHPAEIGPIHRRQQDGGQRKPHGQEHEHRAIRQGIMHQDKCSAPQ
jgi:hypothetical protein